MLKNGIVHMTSNRFGERLLLRHIAIFEIGKHGVSWLSQGSLIFVTIVSSREATEKSVDPQSRVPAAGS
jgi:hypothetical protein